MSSKWDSQRFGKEQKLEVLLQTRKMAYEINFRCLKYPSKVHICFKLHERDGKCNKSAKRFGPGKWDMTQRCVMSNSCPLKAWIVKILMILVGHFLIILTKFKGYIPKYVLEFEILDFTFGN